MIIISITLHNFMSYAEATLDLTTVPVACLSGLNGAGKSAILDAVTWALWESARAPSDELMRIGEKETWVDLTFLHENRTYRVRRQRIKGGGKSGGKTTAKGTLEFQILASGEAEKEASAEETESGKNGHGNSHGSAQAEALAHEQGQRHLNATLTKDLPRERDVWRSLTGNSMKDTQKHICELLRMDYDTFINSAYLRQGKADEFTMRAASDRKQVLGEILGLSYFEKLKDQARDHARTLKVKREAMEMTLSRLPACESELEQADSDLIAARSELTRLSEKLNAQEEAAKLLSDQIQSLMLNKQKMESTASQIEELNSLLVGLEEKTARLSGKLDMIASLASESPAIEEKATKYEKLRSAIEEMERKALIQQELTTRRMDLQSTLATLRSRLELQVENVESRLKELEKKHKKLSAETEDWNKVQKQFEEFRELSQKEAEQSKNQEAHTRLTERAAELSVQVTEEKIRLEAKVSQKELQQTELASILTSKESLDEQHQSIEKESHHLDALEAEFEIVEQRGLEIKSEIEGLEAHVSTLSGRQKENLEKIKELEEHVHSSVCPLCCAPIVDRKAVITRYLKQNDDLDSEIAETKNRKSKLESERADLRRKYSELKKQLENRKELDKRIGQLNERRTAVERAEENFQAVKNELALFKKQWQDSDYAQVERESLIAVKAEIHKLDFDPISYSSLKGQVRAQRHIESRYNQMKRDRADLKELEIELPHRQDEFTKLTADLKGETYGQEAREALKEVKEKLDELKYNRQEHLCMREELEALAPALEQVRELKRALEEKPLLKENLDECLSLKAGKQAQLKELKAALTAFQEQVEKLPERVEALEALKPELEALRKDKEQVSNRSAICQARLDTLNNEIAQMKDRRRELKDLDADIEDYLFLSESFGRKGIQAVIIENAVPEIESDANRILSRLSDNRMHVALITQQKTKAGSMVETLDLMIADEVGTRSYELYSGGEAFKVNFAVRVALSRLLARRSGAKLETLIIDEGFGSQDEVSRDRLVKAIRSIQNDFARILVITHMSDIKEMFPAHIQVTKQNGTSKLQLMS
ncbi:MAG: SMC family ATPase [Candidatus Melainabacteria bacterium]|nr:SMC family ATPase [Candidatus Melainabacteria bacterium]